MISKEFKVLLFSARSKPDSESLKELLKEHVDWQEVLRLAARHSVRPLLLRSLKSVCWDVVPVTIQKELTLFTRKNAVKNLIYIRELIELIDEFNTHSIASATIKGPIISYALYDNFSMREFSDLDIVVREDDVEKAETILIRRGYTPDFADANYRSVFLKYLGQYAFRNRNTGITIDLHWQLAPKGLPFPVQADDVWSKLEAVQIAHNRVPTLALDDLALFLAAHGTKEGWSSLIWICDFAEFLRKNQRICWTAIFERARRMYCSRSLLLAANLARDLLSAPAPATLLDRAQKDKTITALSSRALLRMVDPNPQGELIEFRQSLDTCDRLRDRLRPILTLLTTRTVGDYRAMRLPKLLWGLYYLTRPFRLTMKAANELVLSKETSHVR